jgi:predicted dienelactone hydrolase
VVIFIHGTASWRSQSLTQMTHWASRGFVVISSDHPGYWMADMLGLACGVFGALPDLSGDTDAILAALADPSGDIAFLTGLVDAGRIAIAGHSAGGNVAASQASKPDVRVAIAMGSTAPIALGATLDSALFLGSIPDPLVPYSLTRSAYDHSALPKRLVGLNDVGHLAFSDVCELENSEGRNIVEIAIEAGVCGADLAQFLVDCDPAYLDAAIVREIVDYSTTAVLERALRCVEGPDPFADFQATYPDVGEYREAL